MLWVRDDKTVFFSLRDPVFDFMSNFYPCSFEWNGVIWSTSEHMYQALKMTSVVDMERVRLCISPAQTKVLSRQLVVRSDWHDIKLDMMRLVLRQKFAKGSFISSLLLETEDLILVEEAPWDSFWGAGSDCQGLNQLGILLMERRGELRLGIK